MIQQRSQGKTFILYNSSLIDEPDSQWFSPEFWQENHLLIGQAKGRGTSYFISTPTQTKQNNIKAVLRLYHRGGLPEKIIKRAYFWQGLEKTRAWQEFYLTHKMHQADLPTPTPLAARVVKKRFTYTAEIITQLIDNTQTLEFYLDPSQEKNSAKALELAGKTTKLFHDFGLNHIDLNPNNILIKNDLTQAYLIDFDRCNLIEGNHPYLQKNIARLMRAFIKLENKKAPTWLEAFIQGYNAQNLK